MELIKENIAELIRKIDTSDEKDIKVDEIKLNLLSLEKEIEKYRKIEIYKEDFSEISWSYVTENNNLKSVITYTTN